MLNKITLVLLFRSSNLGFVVRSCRDNYARPAIKRSSSPQQEGSHSTCIHYCPMRHSNEAANWKSCITGQGKEIRPYYTTHNCRETKLENFNFRSKVSTFSPFSIPLHLFNAPMHSMCHMLSLRGPPAAHRRARSRS